jgi:hypothetical protein
MQSDEEGFFVSDSLKDILDKEDLLQISIEEKAKVGDEVEVVGKFLKLSMSENTFAIVTDRKMVKVLLQNPLTEFTHQFMDETWLLSAASMGVKQLANDFEVTLAITGRR